MTTRQSAVRRRTGPEQIADLHGRLKNLELRLAAGGAGSGAGGGAWEDITGKPPTYPPTPQALNWLTDVYFAAPAAGHYLGYDGTTWTALLPEASAAWEDITGKPATFPGTPQPLDWLTDASGAGAIDGKLLGYTAGQWVPVDPPIAVGGIAPVGTITLWGADTAPVGWLLCNGAAISRTTYSDLFATIGTIWGAGDGTSTFNVPNLSGRFPLGAGPATSPARAASGGAWDHTHTQPTHTHTGPSHDHGSPTGNAGSHSHLPAEGATTNVGGSSGNRLYLHNTGGERHAHATTADGVHAHSITAGGTGATGASGGDTTGAANPPWLGVAYIIKATPGGADAGEDVIAWADITGKPTAYPPIPQALDWLTDVDTAAAAEGRVLTYTAGIWTPTDPAAATEVGWADITGKPATFPPTAQPLGWLTDVDVDTPAVGDTLTWDGTGWVAAEPTGGNGGTGGPVDWSDITGKPATYPPSDHSNSAHSPSYLATTGGTMSGNINMNSNELQTLPKPTGNSQPLRVLDGYSVEAVGLGPTIHIGGGAPSGGRDNDVWLQF